MKDLYKRLGAFRLCIVAHCTDTEIEQFDTCLLDLRSLIAHATETCEWNVDYEGTWFTSCGDAHVFTCEGPVEHKHKFCPYCGRTLVAGNKPIETAGETRLTETPRPATTGEGMGEKDHV